MYHQIMLITLQDDLQVNQFFLLIMSQINHCQHYQFNKMKVQVMMRILVVIEQEQTILVRLLNHRDMKMKIRQIVHSVVLRLVQKLVLMVVKNDDQVLRSMTFLMKQQILLLHQKHHRHRVNDLYV